MKTPDFKAAFTLTMGHEGGYSNHVADAGGETYRGVARNSWPNWEGWKTIDALKGTPAFPKNLSGNPALQEAVEAFYRRAFWDRFQADQFPSHDIALEVFDTGVNCGVGTGVKFLQRALNVMNKRQALYPDVEVDGDCGGATLAALNTLIRVKGQKGHDLLLKVLNTLQGGHYVALAERKESQETFVWGWFERVTFPPPTP